MKKDLYSWILVLTSILGLNACTSLATVSLTTIPAQRNSVVKAEASKTIFLGFNFDNDFVNDMENQLKRQCPNGIISGILTKDEVIDYFLFIVWQHRVTATGYCTKANGTADQAPRLKTDRNPAQESDSGAEQ